MAYPSLNKKGKSIDDIDRLSGLPDDILHVIMSCLPMKSAAALSILCKRWRHLFNSLPDIDFVIWAPWIESKGANKAIDEEFWDCMKTGYRLIIRRNGAPIRRFHLSIGEYLKRFSLAIDCFVSAALLCKVQELEIAVGHDFSRLSFPEIFMCETLTTLKLQGDVELALPDSVCLPKLKVLHLTMLRYRDENCIPRLIRGCPLLEELKLLVHLMTYQVEVFHLCCPSLKRLTLTSWAGKYSFFVESDSLEDLVLSVSAKHNIRIDAPNLQSFDYQSQAVPINFIQKLKCLVTATICVKDLFREKNKKGLMLRGEHTFEVVNELQSAKSLSLYQHSLQALCYSVYHSRSSLPAFKNLATLSLDASYYGYFDPTRLWKMLPRLLESAPNLEVLIFHQVIKNDSSGDQENVSISAEDIPLSFCNHLREIRITEFKETEFEFKLVEYFLQNGNSVKKITIGGIMEHSESSKRLLALNKYSEDCQIVFTR